MNTSSTLKAITGVLLIDVQGESKLVCLEDLQNSKAFSTGQIFNAIRVLNDKSISDYKNLWPHYRDQNGDISNAWKTIEEVRMNKCNSDWEFILEVCHQLKEDVPQIVERSEVLKNLDKFKMGQLI